MEISDIKTLVKAGVSTSFEAIAEPDGESVRFAVFVRWQPDGREALIAQHGHPRKIKSLDSLYSLAERLGVHSITARTRHGPKEK